MLLPCGFAFSITSLGSVVCCGAFIFGCLPVPGGPIIWETRLFGFAADAVLLPGRHHRLDE